MLRTLLFLLFTLCCVVFSKHRESATPIKPTTEEGFSALRAMEYLNVIAAETHPIGSTANKKVKDYLVQTLSDFGLEVRVDTGYVDLDWGGRYNKSTYVENVVATLPGSEPTAKKVMLAAHYDSVFEGPGAADDGYAVASMVETVRLLKDQNRKNDVVLLITDGEEMGLLGARLHVKENDMKDVGIVLNYEARGNEGPCVSFEWSDDNAWLVREMKKSSIRPIANSLSYEIYKLMPNSSDFTAFKKRNIAGINHAFIDGFSYYHNPADNIENISRKSVQHTGENMYLMTKHFANYDFSKVEKGNASFFNFYGLLIHYPAGWDLFFLILLGVIFIIIVILARKSNGWTVLNIAKALGWMIFTLLLIGIVNYGFSALVKLVYPQYATFYSYHYYNHEWYFIAGLGIALWILYIMAKWIIRSTGSISQGHAVYLIMALLSIALYFTLPTGTYVMMLPAIAFGLCVIINLLTGKDGHDHWILGILYTFFLAGMWTFLSHNLYLAFSLDALPAAVMMLVIGSFGIMHLCPSIWQGDGKRAILFAGILLFIGATVGAHIKTKPSKKEPLLTNLKYVLDTENGTSYVATSDDYLHEGHQGYFEKAESRRLPRHLPYSTYYKEADIQQQAYLSQITKDTSIIEENIISHTISNPKRASIAYVYFTDKTQIDSLFLNGRHYPSIHRDPNKQDYFVILYGYGLDDLEVKAKMKEPGNLPKFYVNMEYAGFPKAIELPKGMAWNDPTTTVSHAIK